MKTLNAEELKKKLDANEDFVLVNVLPKEYFDERHVPKSVNIPVDQIESKAPSELQDKNAEIIVYCANTECQASPKALKKLEEMGYTNVSDFEAGVKGWEEAGNKFEGSAA